MSHEYSLKVFVLPYFRAWEAARQLFLFGFHSDSENKERLVVDKVLLRKLRANP